MWSNILITLLLFLQCSTSSAALTRRNIHKRQSFDDAYTGPVVPQYNISIPVDHFNESDTRTYNNRYWVNDTYYQPGGPVFVYDYGESGVSESAAAVYLAELNLTTAVMRLAERYNGTAVLWEHRYYGLSNPVPINESTNQPEGGIEGYRYLTIDQALEDVAYFAANWDDMYNPSSTPWIFIGGSYPGVRAALMRIRHPEVIYASWASSAPVEAVYNGSPYFNGMETSLPSNCSADIRAAISLTDEILSGNTDDATLRHLQDLYDVASYLELNVSDYYDLDYADEYTAFDITQWMAETLYVGFQNLGPPNTTDLFCTYLQSYDPTARPGNDSNPYLAVLTNPGTGQISDRGIAATYNASVALDAYFYAARRWWQFYLLSLYADNGTDYIVVYSPNVYADTLAWEYQVMTEIGWFQGSDPDNATIISKFYNYTAEQAYIPTLFDLYSNDPFGDDGVTLADFPRSPNISALNKYGGWEMAPSNVMFTDGEYDPWRAGSVVSDLTWLGWGVPQRNVTTEVPKCNSPPSGTDVFGIIYPGAVHVPDLSQFAWQAFDGSSPMYQGVELFSRALDVWLPCFNSSSGSR